MFQATAGEASDRVCTSCGRDPSLGVDSLPPAPALAAHSAVPSRPELPEPPKIPSAETQERPLDDQAHGWLVFLLAVLSGARWLQNKDPAKKPAVAVKSASESPSLEDVALLDNGMPQVHPAFAGFLDARTPEARAQFVIRPSVTIGRMARFYNLNSWVPIDRRALFLTARAVISLPAGKMIETQWASAEGQQMDAVFANEEGEWRLDWDHFARASDYPWALFLAGSGDDEGEFRLLARERLAKQRASEDTISLALYAPRFGYSGESGSPSPEFLIPRSSQSGRLLAAAFELKRNEKRAFGVKLPDIDPSELVRVRVKVRRVEQGSERRFELDEIIATHWYATDAPGVEISPNPEIKESPESPEFQQVD